MQETTSSFTSSTSTNDASHPLNLSEAYGNVRIPLETPIGLLCYVHQIMFWALDKSPIHNTLYFSFGKIPFRLFTSLDRHIWAALTVNPLSKRVVVRIPCICSRPYPRSDPIRSDPLSIRSPEISEHVHVFPISICVLSESTIASHTLWL